MVSRPLAPCSVAGFTTSFVGLEWVGATRLGDQTLAEQNKDIQPDDMGYGTSFGFRLPGHFFSQADEVKPALFVPLWGFLGEVSQRCKYVGSVGRPGGCTGLRSGCTGPHSGSPVIAGGAARFVQHGGRHVDAPLRLPDDRLAGVGVRVRARVRFRVRGSPRPQPWPWPWPWP